MKKTVLIFSTILIALILSGCGTKRQYFEPVEPAYEVKYDGDLPASIVDVVRDGATLENGQIITKDGLQSVMLPTGYTFLQNDNENYLATNKCNTLIIVDKNSKVTYTKQFEISVASASLKENLLAVVLANNTLKLIDLKNDKEVFSQVGDTVYAHDAKIASPYFLKGLIVYPTLDGKILIIDSTNYKVIKDIVVKSEKFFSNIIYLDVLDDRLVAATNKRVISIDPQTMAFLDEDIRDVIILKNRVLVFTKDGRIILTNSELKVLKEKKFKFAAFAGTIYGEYVYIVERGGYLIATDLDLISTNIYELPDEIETFLFTTKNELFYEDKYFKLSNK
ncbi:MAG TPA: hypothetical protein CFH79_09535 [Sulfurospirillum sp. UBA11407]|nr:MAG TPA: hypothetical protein CFH79_09535 [Sulfurospirillum sp. UBA11407]